MTEGRRTSAGRIVVTLGRHYNHTPSSHMTSNWNSRFTVLLGAPNSGGLQVSPALSARGIDLLRQRPSDVTVSALPEANQPGYATYKHHLPHYMTSYFLSNKVNLMLGTCGLPSFPLSSALKFNFPSLIFGWSESLEDAVLDDLRQNNGASDVMSSGRPGLKIEQADTSDYNKVKALKPDVTFPAIYDYANLSTIPIYALTLRIASLFIGLQQYPAWVDREHFENWVEIHNQDNQQADTEMIDASNIVASFQGTHGRVDTSGYNQVLANVKGLEKFSAFKLAHTAEEVPPYGGLWFPYVADLSLDDKSTVPDVIDRWFSASLGDDLEEVIKMRHRIRSEYGVLGETGAGRALAHLFWCLERCIETQSRPWVITEDGLYMGTAVLGSNFTISVNNTIHYPGNVEKLHDAIKQSGSNRILLKKIASIIKVKADDLDDFLDDLTSTWALRCKIITCRLSPENRSEILSLAKELRFPLASWSPAVSNITKAASYMADDISLDSYSSSEGLPIHHSMLFSEDKDAVIWSCFGAVAPSFRIEGGQKMDLTKNLTVKVPQIARGRKGKSPAQAVSVTRVSLRLVSLKQAIKDLEEMKEEKAILNPFAVPNAKRSISNQYKSFQGPPADEVFNALRSICRVSADAKGGSKGKRKADDQGDSGKPTKRALLDDDF